MVIGDYVASEKQKLREKIIPLSVKPSLVIVQLNDDPASNTYIRGKLLDAEEVGIHAKLIKLAVTTSEQELLDLINSLNEDATVHGFIVQMPLPAQIDEDKIKRAVIPSKDIDGFHPYSSFTACTPKGIVDYLKAEGVTFTGKNALVIGRSNIVGKPTAKLLLQENATVTIAHSRTPRAALEQFVAQADIIVVAVGKRFFLDHTFTYKKEAILIDVGINRFEGITYGDIEPNLPVALQTPVPGGIGLLTRLSLIKNLYEAYQNGIQNH
ncbi:MAG: bifunctional 5,10-methylenetetrahydrofolate dehydrogenase/5,10-methenyltetrahydrofolate cyclohydrolase [Bacilli bacterium]|jgi:methylenetetrahydrofolate dehydrogenase (NADP+)/methenyltetrahydrofolate cyclohydrolase